MVTLIGKNNNSHTPCPGRTRIGSAKISRICLVVFPSGTGSKNAGNLRRKPILTRFLPNFTNPRGSCSLDEALDEIYIYHTYMAPVTTVFESLRIQCI